MTKKSLPVKVAILAIHSFYDIRPRLDNIKYTLSDIKNKF